MPLPLVGVLGAAAGAVGRIGMMGARGASRAGAMQSARNAMSDDKDDKDSDNLAKLRKNSDKTSGRGWVKKAAAWMGVAAIARQSSIASANSSAVAKVLGAYADLAMLPFQPLVNKGLEFLMKPLPWMTKASSGLHGVIDGIINPKEKPVLATPQGTDEEPINYDRGFLETFTPEEKKKAEEMVKDRADAMMGVGGYYDPRNNPQKMAETLTNNILKEAVADISEGDFAATPARVQQMLQKTEDTRNAILDQILLDAQATASAVS